MEASQDMSKLEHQPSAPEEHEQPAASELMDAFQDAIAVILAYEDAITPLMVHSDDPEADPYEYEPAEGEALARPLHPYEGKPVVEHAIQLALDCRFRAVYVLGTDNGVAEVVASVASKLPEGKLSFVRFSRADAFSHADDDCCFEVAGIPKAVLDKAQAHAKETGDAAQIMLLGADQPRLMPWHLLQLHERLVSDADAGIVSSWIRWSRRLPMLMFVDFIRSIEAQGWCAPREESIPWRPLPDVPLCDVVFGEERLEANACVPAAVAGFQKSCTLSALKAVRLARQRKRLEGAGSEDEREALRALEKRIGSLNDADALLFAIAADVVQKQDAFLETDPAFASQVSKADAFGKREKADFPIFAPKDHAENLVYLDSAATSQRLGCALDAEHRFAAYENANIYRGLYALSANATAAYNDARASIERFINADKRQTVLTMNATQSLNLVAQAWGEHNVHEGDVIVVALSEHHSDLLPWMMLAQRKGARVEYIGIRADGTLDQERYHELLKLHPKLVCVAQISNVLGLLNPVREMAKAAHDAGARFVVDAAQSMPHIPLDVKALGADFVAFSGHKLYGPFGIGGLWIAPEAFKEMGPLGSGGGAISHASEDSYYLRQGAIQYELGTPPISQAVGLAAACDHLALIGMENVAAHDAALTAYLVAGLRSASGITVWGDHESEQGRYGVVSFSVAGAPSAQVGALFASVGVAVRSGGHCALPLAASMGITGTTRLSLGIHSTAEDVEAALVALRLCVKLYSAKGGCGMTTVKEHYSEVAQSVLDALEDDAVVGRATCCEAPLTGGEATALYSQQILDALPEGAKAASRGCGDPVSVADIQPGERVLDLGSGGGIDALIAGALVGERGHVFGVDMTADMIALAWKNADAAGVANVEFVQGSIEDVPLPDQSVDVIISNCVVNFCERKDAVFAEAHRLLAPGGRMVISDIVASAPIPEEADAALRRLTGCTNGIAVRDGYASMLKDVGFSEVDIQPKTAYTFEVLHEKAQRKGRMDAFHVLEGIPDIDGLTGSAIVIARRSRS